MNRDEFKQLDRQFESNKKTSSVNDIIVQAILATRPGDKFSDTAEDLCDTIINNIDENFDKFGFVRAYSHLTSNANLIINRVKTQLGLSSKAQNTNISDYDIKTIIKTTLNLLKKQALYYGAIPQELIDTSWEEL
jgi:hypothetical protein